jgi:hypothetical protein
MPFVASTPPCRLASRALPARRTHRHGDARGPPSLVTNLVPAVVGTFCLACPGAMVIVKAIPTTEVVDLVADSRVGLGFVWTPTRDVATVAVNLCAADLARASFDPRHL